MRTRGQVVGILWRVLLCLLLLSWVFHQIIVEKGRSAFEQQGGVWETLSRTQQWRAAWTRSPEELWGVIATVRPGPATLSFLFMGLTIVIGAARWRMVMRVQRLELSAGRAAEISLVTHVFNSLLLGSTIGDLMKAY